jgi:hypothetical protein
MNPKYFLRFALAFGGFLMPVAARAPAQIKIVHQETRQADKNNSSTSAKTVQFHSEGEKIFAQNCSRCHATPDGFSSIISGTIVRHMRVRASLSQHDEEELLRFFNP